ncbi:MAG: RDD family protein [Elusimicrobiaceae bacterium]|nr:RDD family protein [Elusimicrobiaceae bacterium]
MTEEQRINIMEDTLAVTTVGTLHTADLKYASVSERFVALAIDYGIIFLPLQFMVWLVCKTLGHYLELWMLISMVVGMNLVFVLYETVFSSGGRVTLGKNLVGIAVVKKDKSGPLSVPQAFLRAVGYYVSAALFFGGFVLALVDDRKRALHDIFGGSVVVQLRERDTWEVWAVRALGTLLLVLFVGSLYQSFGGRDWQNKYKVRQATDFLQNIALLEEGHKLRYGYYTNDILRLALLSGDPVQFQRDMNKVLSTGKGSVRIGVKDNMYKISALAKDTKKTPVYYTNKL